jgi:hypothetical protein
LIGGAIYGGLDDQKVATSGVTGKARRGALMATSAIEPELITQTGTCTTMFGAAITSVIGAAYTSISFIPVFMKGIAERGRNIATVIFIAVSLFFYLILTTPPA